MITNRMRSMTLSAVALLCAVALQAQTNDTATQSTSRITISNPSSSPSTASTSPAPKTAAPLASFDPGPRPVGNASRPLQGSKFGNTIINGLQPPQPTVNGSNDNNDGAGQLLANPGPTQGFWFEGLTVFGQEATVDGHSNGNGFQTIKGLGPGFNGNSCFLCHSQPTIGGSSPAVNPQVALATLNGATNTVPPFVTSNGPIQEARFILDLANDPSGSTLDGGVHELFTIQGRHDAPPGCSVAQPDFATAISQHNLITRLPIPTFGEGFVENATEAALLANLAANSATKRNIGIFGRFNRNGNDGTITRFGWKAQNKSLGLFAGEAANVEMGVTNEIFQNEKIIGSGCTTNQLSEDNTSVLVPVGHIPNTPLQDFEAATEIASVINNFAIFMRLNAAPSKCDFASGLNSDGSAACKPLGADATAGRALFGTSSNPGIGCVFCHSDTLTTGPSDIPQLNNATFHPFSDFALHHMGSGLTDGISQGLAGPDEFRTPPLWGLGQRLFFLHDGRCKDLVCTIEAHGSSTNDCARVFTDVQTFIVNGFLFQPGFETIACGSEANIVVNNFNALTSTQQQQLLRFLRSL